jgi:hypothetical protein
LWNTLLNKEPRTYKCKSLLYLESLTSYLALSNLRIAYAQQ